MKIGILTFHCAYNYGAMLQTYALQEYLKSCGHIVNIINYRPSYLESKLPTFRFRAFLKNPFGYTYYWLKKYPIIKRRFGLFKEFETSFYDKTIPLYNKYDINAIVKNYDDIIIGSDQVWNFTFNGSDTIWFGDFERNEKSKLISYAASAGNVNFSSEQEKLIKRFLQGFSAISVRENRFNTILKIPKPYEVVLDPTLLVPSYIYNKFINLKTYNKKYIVVREARTNANVYRIAQIIARQLNASLITVDVHASSFKSGAEICLCSPAEFVSIIANASCVVTTSFHAVAISLITQVPFYAIRLNDRQDGRIEDLLKQVGLEDRMLEIDAVPNFLPIDYTNSNVSLDNLRKKSQDFLNHNI